MVTFNRVFVKRAAVSLASLIIVLVLTVQAAVSFCPGSYASVCSSLKPILSPPTLWPFINYPMYSRAHYEGDAISRFFVFGTLEDSTEVLITPADLGIGYWHFRKQLIAGLSTDNHERAKELVELYENKRNRRLVGVRLENHPLIVLKDGVRPGPVQIRKNLRFESGAR